MGGFAAGAVIYVGANVVLARRGARHRKRSGNQQPSEKEQTVSGAAIAIGVLLDGIPESVVLGLSLLGGGVVVGGTGYVFGVWGGIAVASGVPSDHCASTRLGRRFRR